MALTSKISTGGAALSSTLALFFLGGCGDSNPQTDSLVQDISTQQLSSYFSYIDTSGAKAENPQLSADMQEKLSRTLKEYSDKYNIPGMQFVIKSKDKLWIGTVGYANISTKEEMTDKHLFKGAGTTKTFVASLALKLAEEKTFSMDDNLSKWKKELKVPDTWKNIEQMTIKRMLEHTAGLSNYVADTGYVNDMSSGAKVYTPEGVLNLAYKYTPHEEYFGSWHYTNTGYVLVGRISEVASGKSYYDLMQSKVIDPSGLKNTFVAKAGSSLGIKGLARGYYDNQDVTFIDPSTGMYVGDVVTNAIDLARWFEVRVKGSVLSKDSMNMSMNMKYIGDYRPGWKYGLGFYEIYDGYLTHRGQLPGYECGVEYNLRDDTIFSMCANRTLDSGGTLDFTVFPAMSAVYYNKPTDLSRSLYLQRYMDELAETSYVPLNEY